MSEAADEPRSWVLLGGGGHARSVADAIQRRGHSIEAVVDSSPTGSWDSRLLAADADGLELARSNDFVAVPALGSNAARLRLLDEARAVQVAMPVFIALTATVSRAAGLGEGTVVLEHAHVGAGSTVGHAVVVNTAAVVEHDAIIGDGTHVAPGAVILGGCIVGESCLIGAGATVLPSVRIGDGAVIGAGATVTADVDAGATVVGVHGKAGRG